MLLFVWEHYPSSNCIFNIKMDLYFKLLSFTNLNQHTVIIIIFILVVNVMIIY